MEHAHSHLIRSTRHPRGFAVLSAQGCTIAQFIQPHWFRQDVSGTVDGHMVSIKPVGAWKRNFAVHVDGRDAGAITPHPWGTLRITLLNLQGAPVELEFARKSFWGQGYVLRAGKHHVLLELRPRMNWKTFSLDHLLTIRGTGIAPEQLNLVIALSGFAALLIRKRQAAAAG
jgi:hypothetical protein